MVTILYNSLGLDGSSWEVDRQVGISFGTMGVVGTSRKRCAVSWASVEIMY